MKWRRCLQFTAYCLALTAGCALLLSWLLPRLHQPCLQEALQKQPPRTSGTAASSSRHSQWTRHLSGFARLHAPSRCHNGTSPPLVVAAIITSADGRGAAARVLARRLHASVREHRGRRLRWIFVMGASPSAGVQRRVDAEAARRGDILQVAFPDGGPGALKTLAAIEWALTECLGAEFLLRTDDRCVVNPFRLVDYLMGLRYGDTVQLFTGYLPYNLGTGVSTNGSNDSTILRLLSDPGVILSAKTAASARWLEAANGPGYLVSTEVAAAMLAASNSTAGPLLEPDWLHAVLCAARSGGSAGSIRPRHNWRHFRILATSGATVEDSCADWRAIAVRWGSAGGSERPELAVHLWQHASAPGGFNPPCWPSGG